MTGAGRKLTKKRKSVAAEGGGRGGKQQPTGNADSGTTGESAAVTPALGGRKGAEKGGSQAADGVLQGAVVASPPDEGWAKQLADLKEENRRLAAEKEAQERMVLQQHDKELAEFGFKYTPAHQRGTINNAVTEVVFPVVKFFTNKAWLRDPKGDIAVVVRQSMEVGGSARIEELTWKKWWSDEGGGADMTGVSVQKKRNTVSNAAKGAHKCK